MSRRASSFRQTDVARAIRGAVKEGLTVRRAEIDATGKIVLVFIEAAELPGESPDGWRGRLQGATGWDR